MQKSKEDKIKTFDFDGLLTLDKNIFGMPFNAEESDVIIVPVPWDVSVSYKDGTSDAPEAVKKASTLLDLYDYEYKNVWQAGFYMEEVSALWKDENKKLRKTADAYIQYISEGKDINEQPVLLKNLQHINKKCEELNIWLEKHVEKHLQQGKITGVLGGDHSTPLGLLRALAKKHTNFSVLQIDAHADLRDGYEGFDYSHASIMHHALKLGSINKLVQVGVRDVSFQEVSRIKSEPQRIKTFFDYDIKAEVYKGVLWHNITESIITQLGEKVYISFDIDGLEPGLCPNTGTPVPGGLSFNEVCYLFDALLKARKKIIGFDLCEVSPAKNEWDANVGARILFKLCALAAESNK